MLSRVDLPEPFAPSSTILWPGRMVRFNSVQRPYFVIAVGDVAHLEDGDGHTISSLLTPMIS